MRTLCLLTLAVVALLTATLPGQSGLAANVLQGVEPEAAVTMVPESTVLALCAGSGPCEDVFLHSTDGSCVTNLGRPCEEAFADHALRRWVTDRASGAPRAGDTKLLEVIDGQTLVVGYAVGAGLEFARADVVPDGVHVRVVLRFVDHAVPTVMPDGDEVVLRHPMLGFGRELVTLDAPLGIRPVHISIDVEPAQ